MRGAVDSHALEDTEWKAALDQAVVRLHALQSTWGKGQANLSARVVEALPNTASPKRTLAKAAQQNRAGRMALAMC